MMNNEYEKIKIKKDEDGRLQAITESGKIISHVQCIVIEQNWSDDLIPRFTITLVSVEENDMLEGL